MYVSVGQSTASKIITEITDIINEHLAPLYICLPTEEEQRDTTRSYVYSTLNIIFVLKTIIFNNILRFFAKYGMPRIIGVVDGTHISIKKPNVDIEHVYYAVRKSSHTKNVQIVSIYKDKIKKLHLFT